MFVSLGEKQLRGIPDKPALDRPAAPPPAALAPPGVPATCTLSPQGVNTLAVRAAALLRVPTETGSYGALPAA